MDNLSLSLSLSIFLCRSLSSLSFSVFFCLSLSLSLSLSLFLCRSLLFLFVSVVLSLSLSLFLCSTILYSTMLYYTLPYPTLPGDNFLYYYIYIYIYILYRNCPYPPRNNFLFIVRTIASEAPRGPLLIIVCCLNRYCFERPLRKHLPEVVCYHLLGRV